MATAIIIDGNSLLHRAFYALPLSMKRADGAHTNAVYGFFTMLLHAVEQYSPDRLAVAFDLKGKTFRHEMFGEYKAGRRQTPDELIGQFVMLKDALKRLGIAVIGKEGYEADDILGTLAKMADSEGIDTYIITGDRDALQLISGHTSVVMTKKGVTDTEVFDRAHLKETYGLEPAQIIELKALMGDSSDNIPGVRGVGEKTALKLLAEHKNIDSLYADIDSLPKGSMKEKLINGRDSAYLSRTLATIDADVPIDEDMDSIAFAGFDENSLREVLSELGFFSLLKRLSIKKKERAFERTDVNSYKELTEVLSGVRSSIAVVLTDGFLSVSADGEREYRAELNASLFGEGISREEALRALCPLLRNDKIKKLTHDAKQLMHACGAEGFELTGPLFDTMIAAYVLDPTRRNYSLEKLSESYSSGGEACAVFDIAAKQTEEIKAKELEGVLYDIELPLASVLYDMERQGFRVDTGRLMQLKSVYAGRITALTDEIYALCGHEFNIASTKQLGEVLFNELGLPAGKKTKTGFSTDIEVLEDLEGRHPVIEKLIEYRKLTKIKSTYIDGLLTVAGGDGRVHTTFSQTATATGRISSNEPNLQNIPVRSEDSREIREVFLPSEGNVLVTADYSQIELRVLAHIAGDENMTDAFKSGEDVHLRTASEVFGVPREMVTGEMRRSAKAVNFGIVYGISEFGLAKNIGVPRYIAADYIKRYLEEFGGVKRYMHSVVEDAKRDGCVRTLFGRVRYIDELRSANYNVRSFGERAAMNTPIQGTAADIIKCAMIRVYKELKERGLKSKLILQVHDELIIDTVKSEAAEVKELLKDAMENVITLDVPLEVNVGSGESWAEAK